MLRHSGEIYGYFTKWLNALPDYERRDSRPAQGQGAGERRTTMANGAGYDIVHRPPSTASNQPPVSARYAILPCRSRSFLPIFPTFLLCLAVFSYPFPARSSRSRSREVCAFFAAPLAPPPRQATGCLSTYALAADGGSTFRLSSLVNIIREMRVFLRWQSRSRCFRVGIGALSIRDSGHGA